MAATTNYETKITAEAGKQEFFITREFDAPRELVYKAHTDADLIVRWLGPRDLNMRVDKFDARNGGEYRYVHYRKPEAEYGFKGVFHECVAPERIIQTFEFEGLPEKGHVCLETIRFEELPNNRTRLIIQDVFQSVEDRDAALQSGMEQGVSESYIRLDELIAGEIK